MPTRPPRKDQHEPRPPDRKHGGRGCVAVEQHLRMLRTSPEYRWRRREIEREVGEWIGRYGAAGLRTGLIRIPVVVHVLYNTPAQNVSDAQIHSQIDVLNRDFRRLNTDAGSTPAAFAGVAADARLEFALAVRGPGCVATTGITRTSTTVTSWPFPGEGMKAAATGGADPWDVDQYLNIWVVNYQSPTLGYGTFPGLPAAIQGLVVHYRAFGTVGPVEPGAHLGRTATHEIGHYLDLHHIWGDDGSACSGSDLVADTPNQAGASPFDPAACRAFPAVTCANGPDGDMFMNYMDYSGDQCMNMFTAGQSVRMDAALNTQRTGLLASPGLVAPTGVPGSDLWSKDVSDDMGVEPDTSAQPMCISDDIWVRTQNDGLANQDHENPEYRALPNAQPNFVYVRVRNRGCGGTASGTVKLYWAKASSGLSWPAPWDGSVTSPALMGGAIGSAPVTVAGGDSQIVALPWFPPNPADYAAFGLDSHHFCLLSRIETSAAAPYGMTTPETTDLNANVANNNNIVWKNISVVDEAADRSTGFSVANFGKRAQELQLEFAVPEERPTIFDWGRVLVRLPPELADRLRERQGDGIEWLSPVTFAVIEPRASIGGVKLAPGEVHALELRLIAAGDERIGARVLHLDVQQFDGERLVGGVRFSLKTRRGGLAGGDCGGHGPLDGHNWLDGCCGCGCG